MDLDIDEKTKLVDKSKSEERNAYVFSNPGHENNEEISLPQSEQESSSSVRYTELGGSRSGRGTERPDHLSAEEVLYHMNFAFINTDFNAEEEIARAQTNLTSDELQTFKEKILDQLKENSLPLREKINVVRTLHSRHRKRSINKVQYKSSSKTGNNYWNMFFGLWEGSIKMLAAYFGSNVASYFSFLRSLFYLNVFTAIIMFSFTTIPHLIAGEVEVNGTTSGHFGFLSDSLMFYGAYTNEVIDKFNHPMSYLLTWLAVSLFSLIVIGISMNVRYRRSKLTLREDNFEFSMRVFTSWDHSITTTDGTRDHVKAFCTELKEKIQEEKDQYKRPLIKRIGLYVGRLFSNIFVLGLLGGSGYLIYYVAVEFDLPTEAPDFLETAFRQYQLSVVVAGLKLIIPIVFRFIAVVESWHPRTELKVTMARTTLFYFASLVIFISSLYNVATGCLETSQNGPMQSNMTREFCCWENEVGEEVFKLILIDLGIAVAVGIFFHILKAALVKSGRCFDWVGYSEFDVTSSVLDLIYSQGLVWLGLYFTPVIAIIGSIKLIVVFYLRYFVARFANIPPRRVFRASRSGNFYFFLLLLVWILCILPQAYVIIELTPSWDCGPFRTDDNVYDVITDEIGSLPTWLDDVFRYIGTAAVAVPVILLLILIVLYYKVRASSYTDLARQLRNQLVFERKVEKRKVFARAISAPAGSYGKASGSAAVVSANKFENMEMDKTGEIEVIQE